MMLNGRNNFWQSVEKFKAHQAEDDSMSVREKSASVATMPPTQRLRRGRLVTHDPRTTLPGKWKRKF